MSVKINLTRWPGGLGLDVETTKDGYGFAGVCGGGVGHTEKSFILSEYSARELLRIPLFGRDHKMNNSNYGGQNGICR